MVWQLRQLEGYLHVNFAYKIKTLQNITHLILNFYTQEQESFQQCTSQKF